MRQKFVLRLDLHDSKQEQKVVKALFNLAGVVDSVTADLVIGDGVDSVLALSKLLRLFGQDAVVSVEEIKKEDSKDDGSGQDDESGASSPYKFTVDFLKRITNNFSKERIIGRGRHGVVYKGVQDNGVCIAVKKLHLMPGLDDKEFKNKFNNLLRIRHQNTILLLGYCHHTSQVLVDHNGKHISARVVERSLCSEYMQGGNLDKHLSNGPCVLAWHTCYKIIKGICEGLHYLHKGFEYPIYHLELKPTKILLDNDMMPKIGGFGFSRFFDATETFRTSEVTRTSVYMPPEYISKWQITPKFDVFSLGIIILQMMSGKESYTKCADMPPKEFTELVYGFWVNRMQGKMSKHTSCEVRTCIEIALKCLEFSPEKRPTINEIIQKLNKIDIVECSSIGQLYRTKEFSFEFLETITNGFSKQNIVGRGGYGVIYKGLLDNGEEIAVKKFHQMLCIDDELFKNEVNNLMRVQHENIVHLVGYCHHTSQIFVEYKGKHVSGSVVERAICFEYMQGGSLGQQLSAEPCRLDWDKCYKIIKGICEGLHYLHNSVTPIYHLDLKPENILLDKDVVAKIGDFGLSRLLDSAQTYVTASEDLKGTVGYMPPEYINGGIISPKFDVFSLGVIIIKIMAGKEGHFNFAHTPPKEFIKHVCENWRVRMQATMWSHVSEEVRACIEIALKCVEKDRTRRPTIAHIVNELNNISTAQSSPVYQALLGSISMRPLAGKLDMLRIAPPQGCSSESVKDGMQLLREDVEEISSYLDELSELEEPPPTAKCWMNEAHDLSCDIEDYIDGLLFVQPAEPSRLSKNIKSTRSRLKLSSHAKAPKRLKPRHEQIAGRVSEFSMFVQKAIERHQRYDLHSCSSLRRRFMPLGPMLPMRYEETLVTVIDGWMSEFINSLANDEGKQIKVISVLGSSCLGKTTLAMALYNKVGKIFHCRAFIRVSRQPDMKRIFRDMLSQVQLQHPTQDCKEIDLVHTIKTYLQDKRYLIILDDVWDASVWDIINHAFPKGSHGSRIITTTQVEDVALACCCYQSEHVFQMKPLDGDHSRKLFFNTPFASESSCPEQFKGDLNKIVQICGGLPLATISIASLIASQPAMTKDVLKHIHESLSSRFLENSTSERTRQALNLSFNNLPQYLKSCLLYLSMYPEGCEFFKYDLVRQWVAEGFINITEGQDIYKVAESYLDQLIGRRFIQPICISYNNEVVSCAVHDAIHDFIVHKSAEENFIVAINHSQNNVSLSHMVRRLSLLFGDARYAKTPANISKPQIRSLRFSGLFKCMPCIRDFKLLRVLNLHLSGNPGDHDSIDLTGISELFLLRYLKIACDFCIELPKVMGELRCLETLDLMDATRVAAFPWDIIHLPHLLHLTLPVERSLLDWIGNMADSVISLWNLGKLKNLHDLHLSSSSSTLPSSDHLERSMEALGTLLGGHGNLKTLALTHNDRSWHTDASRVTILWDGFGLTPPPLLQRFEFSPHSCIAFSRVPQWVEELGNLCSLKITVSKLQKNCVDILRGLPALTALSLYLETAPIDEIIFGDAWFSVLKYFKFRCSAPWLKFEADAMPTLEKLMLGFNAIPTMDQLQHGNAVISIEHMPGLKEISAKIGGVTANADAMSALRTVVSNHQSNPTINVQLVDFTFYGHESTKQKQRPDEIVGLPVGETN